MKYTLTRINPTSQALKRQAFAIELACVVDRVALDTVHFDSVAGCILLAYRSLELQL